MYYISCFLTPLSVGNHKTQHFVMVDTAALITYNTCTAISTVLFIQQSTSTRDQWQLTISNTNPTLTMPFMSVTVASDAVPSINRMPFIP